MLKWSMIRMFNPRQGWRVYGCTLAGILLSFSGGCGYRVAHNNRLDLGIDSVAVQPFKNDTTTYRVEQKLVQALAQKFVEKTSWEIKVNPSQADAVLSGVVSRVSVSPVTFGQGSFGSTFLVTMDARVELLENSTGRVLFRNDRYIFRDQYQINVDVEQFFTEQNPALDRIAEDFAASVVTSILEAF